MKIVFDIGGTKMRLANSADGLTIVKTIVLPTPQKYNDGLSLLAEQIKILAGDEKVKSITGGLPAVLDKNKTRIIAAPNLIDWGHRNLSSDLSAIFECPVQLENDTALGALGEALHGAGKDNSSIAYIAVGTGIGGAWVLNGQLQQGSYSFDIGHQVVDINGPFCHACNKPGHLESYIKNPDFKKYFLIGLYNTLLHWPADILILGGGVILHSDWNIIEIQNKLQELMKQHSDKITVKIAAHGDEAGLFGALMLSK